MPTYVLEQPVSPLQASFVMQLNLRQIVVLPRLFWVAVSIYICSGNRARWLHEVCIRE